MYGKTKTAVYDKLRDLHRDLNRGIAPKAGYTVNECLDDWLAHARNRVSGSTRDTERYQAENLRRTLGHARLRELTARDVHTALESMTATHSTRPIHLTRNLLERAIRHAEANDLVGRDVAALVTPPAGKDGRASKSLSMTHAVGVIEAAKDFPAMDTYIALSLLSGLRTEEVRALRWQDVDLVGGVVYVLRAERAGGDTKTRKSRRGLKLPQLALDALRGQVRMRQEAGELWQEHGLVLDAIFGAGGGEPEAEPGAASPKVVSRSRFVRSSSSRSMRRASSALRARVSRISRMTTSRPSGSAASSAGR